MKKDDITKNDLQNQGMNPDSREENAEGRSKLLDNDLENVSGGTAWDLISRKIKKSTKDREG